MSTGCIRLSFPTSVYYISSNMLFFLTWKIIIALVGYVLPKCITLVLPSTRLRQGFAVRNQDEVAGLPQQICLDES